MTNESKEPEWLLEGKSFTETPERKELYGFVYLITNLITGRKYVGKKLFWFMKTRQINKKKKRFLAESDWRDYWGSNDELKKDIDIAGSSNFKREILHLCSSKSECSYLEAKEQIDRGVLLSKEYYNSWISLKITKKHLAKYAQKKMLTES
jgi:hypothetical protein